MTRDDDGVTCAAQCTAWKRCERPSGCAASAPAASSRFTASSRSSCDGGGGGGGSVTDSDAFHLMPPIGYTLCYPMLAAGPGAEARRGAGGRTLAAACSGVRPRASALTPTPRPPASATASAGRSPCSAARCSGGRGAPDAKSPPSPWARAWRGTREGGEGESTGVPGQRWQPERRPAAGAHLGADADGEAGGVAGGVPPAAGQPEQLAWPLVALAAGGGEHACGVVAGRQHRRRRVRRRRQPPALRALDLWAHHTGG